MIFLGVEREAGRPGGEGRGGRGVWVGACNVLFSERFVFGA